MIPLKVKDLSGSNLRGRIKAYQKMVLEIQQELSKKPYEWGKFQNAFNYEVTGVFREIMDFEQENMASGNEERVYKLKNLFVKHLRKEFLHGKYIVQSFNKPHGYAGDFEIIDHIYINEPPTLGFDRLYDNYFQMSSISVAVRNRKDDFKRMIQKKVAQNPAKKMKIMDLGSGPGRLISEVLKENKIRTNFYLLDNDQAALKHAKQLLEPFSDCQFIQENAVRMALRKDIEKYFEGPFDMIYSTGLFDYFDDRIILRLVKNLKLLLAPGGTLAISDVRDKYSNPSVHFMEWVGDWNLIYREDERLRQLFQEAGFQKRNLQVGFEQQGILQYLWVDSSRT